jgi:hypothetical protein
VQAPAATDPLLGPHVVPMNADVAPVLVPLPPPPAVLALPPPPYVGGPGAAFALDVPAAPSVPVLGLVPSVLLPVRVQVPAPLPPTGIVQLSVAVAASAWPLRQLAIGRAILAGFWWNSTGSPSRSVIAPASARPAQAPLAVLVQLRPRAPGGGSGTGFFMTSGNSAHCLTARE